MITRSRTVVSLALGLLLVGAGATTAQAPNPGGTFVAILNDFPDLDARSLVVREGGRAIVVLRAEEATVDALAMSLVVLDRMNDRELAPGQGAMAPVTGFLVDVPPDGDQRRRLEAALRRLERAPTTEIGTLGNGRWVRYR